VVAGLACLAVASVAVATRTAAGPGGRRRRPSRLGPVGRVSGRVAVLSPLVLFFGGLGLLLLAAAAINLAVETWSP
jgi:hypothetical protein